MNREQDVMRRAHTGLAFARGFVGAAGWNGEA